MSADQFNEKFDEMLRDGLRKHEQRVPEDFSQRMVMRLREAEEQEILAQVVWEERVALACCVVVGVVAIVAAAVFPRIGASLAERVDVIGEEVTGVIKGFGSQWQFLVVFAGLFGFAIYSLVDLLVGDNGE